jgi:hypothetical protein
MKPPVWASGLAERTGDAMGRKTSAAEVYEGEWDYEETVPNDVDQDRTLVLIRAPISRKVQLMALGVREIRCMCCIRVMPIAGAEELDGGWICEDCLTRGN